MTARLVTWLAGAPGRRCELSAEAGGRIRARLYRNGDALSAAWGNSQAEAELAALGLTEASTIHNAEDRRRAAFSCLERVAELIRQDATEEAIGYLEACAAHVRAL